MLILCLREVWLFVAWRSWRSVDLRSSCIQLSGFIEEGESFVNHSSSEICNSACDDVHFFIQWHLALVHILYIVMHSQIHSLSGASVHRMESKWLRWLCVIVMKIEEESCGWVWTWLTIAERYHPLLLVEIEDKAFWYSGLQNVCRDYHSTHDSEPWPHFGALSRYCREDATVLTLTKKVSAASSQDVFL